jgi:Regulator of chromosome condensation (RCC1) repeat
MIASAWQVPSLDGKNIAQFACGEHFSLALAGDGLHLYSFGRAEKGQLGIGFPSAESYDLPQQVALPKLIPLTAIEAGDHHAMAITAEHEVYTWGLNENRQTGHEQDGDSDVVFRPLWLDLAKHFGTSCRMLGAVGGGLHSLLVVEKYVSHKRKRDDDDSDNKNCKRRRLLSLPALVVPPPLVYSAQEVANDERLRQEWLARRAPVVNHYDASIDDNDDDAPILIRGAQVAPEGWGNMFAGARQDQHQCGTCTSYFDATETVCPVCSAPVV